MVFADGRASASNGSAFFSADICSVSSFSVYLSFIGQLLLFCLSDIITQSVRYYYMQKQKKTAAAGIMQKVTHLFQPSSCAGLSQHTSHVPEQC